MPTSLSLSLEISLGAFHLLPLCALVQCKLERRDRLLYVRKVPGRTVNRCQRGRLAACCCIYNNERGGWQWPHRREEKNISADRDGEKGGEDRRSLAKRNGAQKISCVRNVLERPEKAHHPAALFRGLAEIF